MSVHFSSANKCWETPSEVFEPLNKEFGFTLDPCATFETKKCHKWYGPDEDGLALSWGGFTAFVNPPYGREIGDWVKKAYNETRYRYTMAVMLLPARTDTKWFHQYVMKASEVRFIKGRLRFVGAKGTAPFPSMVVIFSSESENAVYRTWDFRQAYKELKA